MFDNVEDEYLRATQDAQVNIHKSRRRKGLIVIWNLSLLSSFAFIGYLGFNYFQNKPTLLLSDNSRESNSPSLERKTAVMGVSDTKSDREYLEMLNSMEMDIVKSQKDSSVGSAIEEIVNSSTIQDNSLYTQAISEEIDSDIYHQNSTVILVEKGDTLGTIAQKYYGDARAFNKIIEANDALRERGEVIHIGQKLRIPY